MYLQVHITATKLRILKRWQTALKIHKSMYIGYVQQFTTSIEIMIIS